VLPLALPPAFPLLRAATATLTGLFLVKSLQWLAGHEQPRGYLDTLLFLSIPAVVRWDEPRVPDLPRATRNFGYGLLQLAGVLALLELGRHIPIGQPIQLLVTMVGIYLALAGVFNLLVVPLSLRGLAHEDPFDRPYRARTPGEFWGRRWNTWVNHMLYRYAFAPAGGKLHPARAVFAAFAVSAILHEAIVFAGTLRFSGWMSAFFLAQGVLVILTSHAQVRAFAKCWPRLSWALTLLVMLASGVLFVRGAEGIDPSQAWNRCCASRDL